LLITVDTNVIDVDTMNELRAAVTIPHEFAYVTVTERERGSDEIKLIGEFEAAILETGVFDESTWDNAVFGQWSPARSCSMTP
jgi:hypothetical protein